MSRQNGAYPLHVATRNGNVEVVKALIASRADVQTTDNVSSAERERGAVLDMSTSRCERARDGGIQAEQGTATCTTQPGLAGARLGEPRRHTWPSRDVLLHARLVCIACSAAH